MSPELLISQKINKFIKMNDKTSVKKVLNFGMVINIFELEYQANVMNDY